MAKNDNFQDGDIKIRVWDGTTEAEVDSVAGYLVGIATAHHKVHEKVFFSTFSEDTDVDVATPKTYYVKTGAKRLHWQGEVSATYGLTAKLWRDTIAVTDSGTIMVLENHSDTTDAGVSTCEWYEDATFSGGTVALSNRIYGTGTNNNNRVGGSARSGNEYIMEANSEYFITFTVDADDQSVFFNSAWYEQTV